MNKFTVKYLKQKFNKKLRKVSEYCDNLDRSIYELKNKIDLLMKERNKSNEMKRFFTQRCEFDSNGVYPAEDLFDDYKRCYTDPEPINKQDILELYPMISYDFFAGSYIGIKPIKNNDETGDAE